MISTNTDLEGCPNFCRSQLLFFKSYVLKLIKHKVTVCYNLHNFYLFFLSIKYAISSGCPNCIRKLAFCTRKSLAVLEGPEFSVMSYMFYALTSLNDAKAAEKRATIWCRTFCCISIMTIYKSICFNVSRH